MKIEAQIKNYKQSLILKAKEKGIYENFGQAEVRKLRDKYPCLNTGNQEELYNKNQIEGFEEWAMNLDDRKIKELR